MVEQRLVFGRVAEIYDDTRASYPEALFDDIVGYAGLRSGDQVLEAGGGTGIATRSFAARGLDVHVLEPSEQMAAVLRTRTPARPTAGPRAGSVTVETGTFEDWTGRAERFALVAAAQSWHWVDADVRYLRAREALRDGGTIALFGHRPRPAGRIGEQIGAAYRRYVPEHTRRPYQGNEAYAPEFAGELVASGLFESVEHREYAFVLTYDADRLVRWFTTMSDHQLLPDDRRAALHAEIAQIVTEAGGAAEVRYRTDLYLARAR